MSRIRRKRTVIMGGGIVGALLADLLTEAGYHDVTIIKISEADRPQADSHRNHGWLHSGILYYPNPLDASLMRMWGQNMSKRYGIPARQGISIFRTSQESTVIDEISEKLKIPISIFSEEAAKRLLGDYYVEWMKNYRVLDRPFDPSYITKLALKRAEARGAKVIVADPASLPSLKLSSNSPSGFEIQLNGEVIYPETLFLCAGAQIPKLLEDLGIYDHKIQVFRSILLNCSPKNHWSAQLLDDFETGLSIVRQESAISSGVCFDVIGGRGRTALTSNETLFRKVTRREIDEILDKLPLKAKLQIGDDYRVTAGYKTELIGDDGQSVTTPYFREVQTDKIKNLFIAFPAKATLGLYTAKKIGQIAGYFPPDDGTELPSPPNLPPAAVLTDVTELKGSDSTDEAKMHWDYEGEDEKEN